MKLKKKIAIAMAVATVCSSIMIPVKAEAACDHYYKHDKTITNTYTQQHGYSVGDNEYKNCVITTIKKIIFLNVKNVEIHLQELKQQ